MSNSAARRIVVITGGSGFLAQHLIKEIQSSAKWSKEVEEIRVVDKKLFKKFLDYPENIPIKEYIGDVGTLDEIEPALTGASIVFHMAARRYNFDMYPNKELFTNDNIRATKTLIYAMTLQNVPWLVYTGDALSVLGNEDAQGVVEAGTLNPPAGEWWLLGPYGETKFRAEMLVRASNDRPLDNGGKLKTICIRPTPLYGEGDSWFVPHALRICQQYGGYLQHFGTRGESLMQFTYAGNAASMHLRLADLLIDDPSVEGEWGGEVFNCTELTRPVNYYQYIQPFVEMAGYRITKFSISYLVGFWIFLLLEFVFGVLATVGRVKFPHNLPNRQMVIAAAGLYFHFSMKKASQVLDYNKPTYDPDEAMKRTVDWWKANYTKPYPGFEF